MIFYEFNRHNKNLWIKLNHCEGNHYLLGNCHTFPGRMNAYCELKDKTFCVSSNEIIEMTTESDYWIRGFLSGNEPEPPEELEMEFPDDYFNSERFKKWVTMTEKFKQTGQWDDEKEH